MTRPRPLTLRCRRATGAALASLARRAPRRPGMASRHARACRGRWLLAPRRRRRAARWVRLDAPRPAPREHGPGRRQPQRPRHARRFRSPRPGREARRGGHRGQRRERRGSRGQPGRLLVRHRQLAGHPGRRAALPPARERRVARLRRVHRDGRELGPLGRVRRQHRLVPGGCRGGQCQLPHLSRGHRHRRVLVHRRPRGSTRTTTGPGPRPARGVPRRPPPPSGPWPRCTSPTRWCGWTWSGPGYQALDNGWDNAYTSPCSGRVAAPGMAPAVDRAVLNGYQAYLTAHSSYRAGVYSSPLIWNVIFGAGAAASIPNLDEWTYTDGTRDFRRPPAAGASRAPPPAPGSSAG